MTLDKVKENCYIQEALIIMNNIRGRKGNIKIYITPFVIITLISLLTMLTMSHTIRNYFYVLKKEEVIRLLNKYK